MLDYNKSFWNLSPLIEKLLFFPWSGKDSFYNCLHFSSLRNDSSYHLLSGIMTHSTIFILCFENEIFPDHPFDWEMTLFPIFLLMGNKTLSYSNLPFIGKWLFANFPFNWEMIVSRSSLWLGSDFSQFSLWLGKYSFPGLPSDWEMTLPTNNPLYLGYAPLSRFPCCGEWPCVCLPCHPWCPFYTTESLSWWPPEED